MQNSLFKYLSIWNQSLLELIKSNLLIDIGLCIIIAIFIIFVYYLSVKRNNLNSIFGNIRKKLTVKNFMRICTIGILTAIFRYILMEKFGFDIKQTYDFFCLFIPTGIFAGIINLIYEDTYTLLSSNAGGPGVGGAGIGAGGNPFAVNPAPAPVNPAPAPAPVNPPAGNIWGNPQQLRAGQINGPIQVNDPNNQNYVYNNNGSNQPLLGNIARALDHQANLRLTSLSRFTFTREQEQFILAFLQHNHRGVYDNLMHDSAGYPTNKPIWWKQSNTKIFRDLLRNAN